MTITQFKYVVEIAKYNSINAAARQLFVSQSVISTSIKNLENELGTNIFHRTNKGIKLTPFGDDFLSYIRPIVMQVENLSNMNLSGRDNYTFKLSIASLGYYFLSDVLAEIQEKYKSAGTYINSIEGSIDDVISAVHEKRADFGILRIWDQYKNITARQLNIQKISFNSIATLNLGITVGKKNPLYYSEDNYVTGEQLASFPVVMYPYMDAGVYSDVYKRLNLPLPKNKFVTNSRATIYELVSSTDTYHLNSIYVNPSDENINQTKNVPHDQRTLILKDHSMYSEIGWIKRDDTTLSSIATETIRVFSSYINTV